MGASAGGGEDTEGAASIMGIIESGTIFYLTDLNDRLGFDTAASGCAMAVAFEAFEKGIIPKEDTGGLELTWGNAEAAEALLRQMSRREGFGQVVADGALLAGMRLGIADAAIHIKGAAMNLHDWRAAWGVLLGQIVGGGSGWPGPGEDCWATEPDIGYPKFTDPISPKVRMEYEQKLANFEKVKKKRATGFFVVVGSFKEIKFAESFAAKVKSMGYKRNIIEGSNNFNCVTSVTFETLKESLSALNTARTSVTPEA